MTVLANRYDFVLPFDVRNGNPNGDPDAGNLPRLDPETNHGLVSDVSLKRKVRNYAELAKAGETGYAIYVSEGAILNEKHREAYKAARPGDAKVGLDKKLNPKTDDEAKLVRDFMCANFFDVRTFCAVMSTGINCGQVRGPVQLSFAISVEPIVPLEISITRMAATTFDEKTKREQESEGDERAREPHHGPKVHRALRPLSRARLCLGQAGRAHRVLGGRPPLPVGRALRPCRRTRTCRHMIVHRGFPFSLCVSH